MIFRVRAGHHDLEHVARVVREDARAGGTTEAEEAGVDIGTLRDGLTHTDAKTTARYIRRRTKKNVTITEARKEPRSMSAKVIF